MVDEGRRASGPDEGARSQDEWFLRVEGDAYTERNRAVEYDPERDPVLSALRVCGVRPSRVVDYGCSTGSRLAHLARSFGCAAIGIEPSAVAVAACRERWPEHEWRVGTLAEHEPIGEPLPDLAICSFVLHWVGRDTLFASLARIDRQLSPGGILVVYDFLPLAASRRSYHHRREELYTFKADYARVFQASGAYDPLYSIWMDRLLQRCVPSPDLTDLLRLSVLRKRAIADYPLELAPEVAR